MGLHDNVSLCLRCLVSSCCNRYNFTILCWRCGHRCCWLTWLHSCRANLIAWRNCYKVSLQCQLCGHFKSFFSMVQWGRFGFSRCFLRFRRRVFCLVFPHVEQITNSATSSTLLPSNCQVTAKRRLSFSWVFSSLLSITVKSKSYSHHFIRHLSVVMKS